MAGQEKRCTKLLNPSISYENIPGELKALNQWVLWGPRKNGSGKTILKTPIDPKTGTPAKSNDPNTWGSYAQAVEALAKIENVSGIGFVFSATGKYCGVDLDKCRNPRDGEVEPWALGVVKAFDSYTEISPSGCGLHIIIEGKKPGPKCRKGKIEIYDRDRFFTITGNLLPEGDS